MKFALPRIPKGSLAGLVIRAGDVELLVMEGPRVVSRVRVPIEGEGGGALSAAVQQACAAAHVKTRKMAVALPTEDVFVRFFLMPMLPKAERDLAVQFEARKYVPFKTESLAWDYHAIESPEAHRLEVVFTAVQRDTLRDIRAALADAGIHATRMEPRSLSLARLTTSEKGDARNEFVCLVEVERARAHLVIARAGAPYLTRDVTLSEELEEPGKPQPSTGEAQTADPQIRRLFSELRVSLDFFTREYPGAAIPRVVLIGERSLMESWQPSLADELGRTVEVGGTLIGSHPEEELPLSFASAFGLLQGERGKRGVSLDFLTRAHGKAAVAAAATTLPARVAADAFGQLRSTQAIVMGSVAVAALIFLWALGRHEVAMAQAELALLIQARPDAGWGTGPVDEKRVDAVHDAVRQQLELVRRLVDGRVGVVAKLDMLARSLSDGMWLTGLSFEERTDESGRGQVTLKVNGACYLEQSGKEILAIQAFEDRVKGNPALFEGFSVARVEQIKEQAADRDRRRYTYREFQLQCRSDRKL